MLYAAASRQDGWRGTMTPRLWTQVLLVAVIVTTIGCDRVTKRMAVEALAGGPQRSFLADTVRLVYAENTGGFLSLGADLPPRVRTSIFTIATGVMLIAFVTAGIQSRWDLWSVLGLTLLAAGGASNWADRVVHGRVVDFLNVGIGPLRTGIFNVADVAIMGGVVILLLTQFSRSKSPAAPHP
jgi:signal peptidase II